MCLQMYVAVKFHILFHIYFTSVKFLFLCMVMHVEGVGGGGGETVSSLLFASNLVRGVHVHASSELRETRVRQPEKKQERLSA